MKHLSNDGIVIYLKISFDVMMERIRNIKTRGILLRENESMRDMFDARERLYEKYADVIISCDGANAEETVAEICRAVR